MNRRFTHNILPHVNKELALAKNAYANNQVTKAFGHLENAHVLGQKSTWLHVKVHYLMLQWGWRQRQYAEVWGQCIRIIGAATKTMFGLVPTGNTGGANISPLKPLPLTAQHAQLIQQAETQQSPQP